MRRSRSHNARRPPARCLGHALAILVLSLTPKLRALEPVNAFGAPLQLDLTNSSSLLYNFDNRDTRPNQVATLANDHWGLFTIA
jgi:hypothetical protein